MEKTFLQIRKKSGHSRAGPQQSRISTRPDGWSVEIRFGLEELGLTRGNRRIGFNFRRARLEDNRWAHYDWQPVRSEDSGPVFGTLILPKTGFN